MIPSAYQQAILDWADAGSGSAVVIAVAGSGKTSLLEMLAKHVPPSQRMQVFAYNKNIGDELRNRTRSLHHVTAGTVHSTGYRAVSKELGLRDLKPTSGKLRAICEAWLSTADYYKFATYVCKLVEYGKGEGLGIAEEGKDPLFVRPRVEQWQALIDHHGLDFEKGPKDPSELDLMVQTAINMAGTLLQKSCWAAREEFAVDWDDLLYLPLLWNLPLQQSPWVCIDEAQDTNRVRREMMARALTPNGRLVAVGDPRQSIYGFSGASIDAIDLIEALFDAIRLPLSVCYRCARAIVEEAQRLVPEIEPCEGAADGCVQSGHARDVSTLKAGDAILCRNTAPLIEAAYHLIANGRPCIVRGVEIGEGLVRLVQRMKVTEIDDLEPALLDYKEQTREKMKEKSPALLAKIEDDIKCIRIVLASRELSTIPELIHELTSLFHGGEAGKIILSTIHKAKGMEWLHVAIYKPELMPSKWATKPWQIQQERNLRYVAITRARQTLTYLEGSVGDQEVYNEAD